jgi:hypothetical protein
MRVPWFLVTFMSFMSFFHRHRAFLFKARSALHHRRRLPLIVARPCVGQALDFLINHPAADWGADTAINAQSSPARKKLTAKHAALFASSSLFDEFARALAVAGVVPRKEVFETWAAALLIDAHTPFATSRRVVDVACGHGLLAWALVVLDDARTPETPRTALCVDRRIPASAEAAHAALSARWPHLSDRVHHVEGGLADVDLHPSCLAVSVHACGTLSDVLVRAVVRAGAPLALVPCCHSRKKLAGCYAEENADLYNVIIDGQFLEEDDAAAAGPSGDLSLARALDGARQAALRRAGHDVHVQQLPDKFTAKNTLILASPVAAAAPGGHRPPHAPAASTGLPRLTIPCADTADARAAVAALAGRAAADRRIRDRAHALLAFDISLWLGEGGPATSPRLVADTLHADAVSQLVTALDGGIVATVELLDEYQDASVPRLSRTFRVRYAARDDGEVLARDRAVAAHRALYTALPTAFPGATCRVGNKE